MKNNRCEIFHPGPYVERQIAPALKNNDLSKEVVWTFLVARKYQDNQESLVERICGVAEELPEGARIWLETYLHPTRRRQEEVKCWRSRADLSLGHLEIVSDRESQIRANGEWVSIVESKWYDDIHSNPEYPKILQLSQLIEHALLLHDIEGNFPERVYVTLLTPQYFKNQEGPFSDRNYQQKFEKYKSSPTELKTDLQLCPLAFLSHDLDTLLGRIDSLVLRWVTFEELLELPPLVSHKVPGKYKTNFWSWEQVFSQIGMKSTYYDLLAGN
ncbi:MAG: hypothetical protein ACQETR_14405 [Thermodesulfobacteriota bacterium]